MRELEKNLKALANRRRLAILKYLKGNPDASVGRVAKEIKCSFKAASKHLGILLACNIVERDQHGFEARYCLSANQNPAARHTISLL